MIFKDRNFLIALTVGCTMSAISYPVANILGADIQFSLLEFSAVLTSYICTILCVTLNRSNYFFGIVSTFLYSMLFYQAGLPALALFNAILVVSLIYGYWRWGPDGNPIPVTDISWSSVPGYLAFALLVGALMTGVFRILDTEVMRIDVAIAGLSAMAQLMLDNKKRANWCVWIVVNVFSIYLFVNQGLYLVAFQYVFFLGNAFVGLYAWSKSMKNSSETSKNLVDISAA